MNHKNGPSRDIYGLTKRQRLFCDYYLLDPLNPKRAALQAGYSETAAQNAVAKILTVDAVQAYISARLPDADLARAKETRALIASGDEVNAFLSQVMRGEVKDAFGLDPGLSDRISAAKELRRVYDIADKYRNSTNSLDDLSRSLDAFTRGEYIDADQDAESVPGRSQDMVGSPSVVDSDPTPTPTENISCSTDKESLIPGDSDSGDFQNSDPQKNFENAITGG